jgi:hypothetical protein
MSKPWLSSTVTKGELTVYNDLKSGNWVHIFESARQAFNELKLPVTLKAADDKKSADVIMGVSTGSTTFDYDGSSYPGKALDPTMLHGATRFATGEEGTMKAFVFLPSQPKSSPRFLPGGKVEYEEASLEMMKVIAVHELVHACGLENSDHATTGGVFYFPLAPDGKGKIIAPVKGQEKKAMPPLWLDAATKTKLVSMWQRKKR